MNDNAQPVNRSEFNAAVRHLETLLGQQTTILQTLAVAASENKTRDERAAFLTSEIKELKADVAAVKIRMTERFAWLAGAGAIVMAAWPILAKKLGFL